MPLGTHGRGNTLRCSERDFLVVLHEPTRGGQHLIDVSTGPRFGRKVRLVRRILLHVDDTVFVLPDPFYSRHTVPTTACLTGASLLSPVDDRPAIEQEGWPLRGSMLSSPQVRDLG